jgi:REP element-mobilizing transposase RayT
MTGPRGLAFGACYHIFHRGNNRENIFFEDRNFFFFMRLYAKYIPPIADTYAYSLLRNHFHLCIRIKTLPEILCLSQDIGAIPKRNIRPPSRHFSNLLNAYAKAINKTYHRTGSLFAHPFGRRKVENDRQRRRLIAYIHRNPQHHGLAADFRDWPFSSWHVYASNIEDGITTKLRFPSIPGGWESWKTSSWKVNGLGEEPLRIDDFS